MVIVIQLYTGEQILLEHKLNQWLKHFEEIYNQEIAKDIEDALERISNLLFEVFALFSCENVTITDEQALDLSYKLKNLHFLLSEVGAPRNHYLHVKLSHILVTTFI